MRARLLPIWLVAILALALAGPLGAAETERGEGQKPRPWLGVYLGPPASTTDDDSDTGRLPGVRIEAVVKDSPAERAGLRASDEILAVDATPVSSSGDLISFLRETTEPGRWVQLTVRRGNHERTISARLAARPTGSRFERRRGWLGMGAIELPESLREHFGAPADSGVMVHVVVSGSPADSAGLEVGDVVFAVGGEPFESVGALARRVAGTGVGNTVELTVMRGGAEITLEALIEEAPEKPERE